MHQDGLIIRARAPLRIGLAGGGTDLSPYCDEYGGSVLNATISNYAYATIQPRAGDTINFVSNDLGSAEELPLAAELETGCGLRLHRAVYNRIVRDYNDGQPLALTLTTSVECPEGAGLGASSALVVAVIGAFKTLLGLPLGDFDIAHLAYEIERKDLAMSGGRQDQYAATFGGMNFMEFARNDRVIVNPLHLERRVLLELEASIMLCFTGTSRVSSDIIDQQVTAMETHRDKTLDALHQLKRDALEMKAALLRNELHLLSDILRHSWEAKKTTASSVTSQSINALYEEALDAGGLAGKISGAGGGGFMILLVDPLKRENVKSRLEGHGATLWSCKFSDEGVQGWTTPIGT
ncbi:MAG: dehydrogenase [Pseudomonadota bacterium]